MINKISSIQRYFDRKEKKVINNQPTKWNKVLLMFWIPIYFISVFRKIMISCDKIEFISRRITPQ